MFSHGVLFVQEVLDFNLIVCNPYRDLAMYLKMASAGSLAECAWCDPPSSSSNLHKACGVCGKAI